MDLLKQKLEEIFKMSGLSLSIDVDSTANKVTMFIHDEEVVNKFFPKAIFDIEHIVKIIAKKLGIDRVGVDVNNYKRERETLITELAKAAARKVLAEKKEIALPAMNAYERRIVHVELATRPDVKTESLGEGSERHIIVKPLL
ncbi:MAG: R3H domain-containing nucleic acid-binding protein [bacterium]|nr:R3H domain-containing nucleic acid-binding protein [bacterium]